MLFAGCHIAQFTAHSTPRETKLQVGFLPDVVLIVANHTGTNPDLLLWINKGGRSLVDGGSGAGITQESKLSQWLDADDHLLVTGSTGVITRVTTGINEYAGGEVIAADELISSNPVHPFSNGTFPKAGCITAPGLLLPAAILTASALYMVLCFRQVQNEPAANLHS